MIKKFYYVLFIYFFCVYKLLSFTVDLTEIPAYIKQGYINCDIKKSDVIQENDWIFLPPNKGNRSIVIPKIKFKDLPQRRFIEFRSLPKQDFTLVFFIDIPEHDYKNIQSPGIYFERIGESWEIFWNNNLIDKKISYEKSLTIKGYIVKIPLTVLKEDTNVLCIHIIGDPISTRTGFYYGSKYYLDELTQIFYNKIIDYILIFFIITLYISFGIFNFIFYLKQKENKYNLYFSLFCFIISLYIFIRSPLPQYFQIINDPDIISPIEFISLFSLIPVFSLFFYDIIKNKLLQRLKLIFRIIILHGVLFIFVMLLPISSNAYGGILILWQFSALIFISIITLIIIFLFYINYKNLYKINRPIQTFFKTLIYTIPGNFLIGTIFITVLSIFDIYFNIKKISAPNISNYGFLIFSSVIAFRIAFNIINLLNRISVSEKKYSYLYHHSSDIIILLNKNFIIKEMNDQFKKILKWDPELFYQKSIETLIYKHEKERNPAILNLVEYLQNELKEKNSISIILPLRTKSDIPFLYFEVHFSKLDVDDFNEFEIIMKCSIIKKDPMFEYLEKEYKRIVIDTNFINIERLLPVITESLLYVYKEIEISFLRIALREILINAIEHGNLGITNEEKTKFLHEGIYDQILKERLSKPEYKNKKITIEFRLTKYSIIYKITDEGQGFDAKEYLNLQQVNTDSFHGRGIFITKNAFDKVIYNKKGNSVLLIKKIKKVS